MISKSNVFVKVNEIISMVGKMIESKDFLSNDVNIGLLSQALKEHTKNMEQAINGNRASK